MKNYISSFVCCTLFRTLMDHPLRVVEVISWGDAMRLRNLAWGWRWGSGGGCRMQRRLPLL